EFARRGLFPDVWADRGQSGRWHAGCLFLLLKGKPHMFLKEALFTRTSIPMVEKSLDACALRGRAISNNLANLTTPGYQRIEVSFEERLKAALDLKNPAGVADKPGHQPLGRPDPETVKAYAYRSEDPVRPGDINNV